MLRCFLWVFLYLVNIDIVRSDCSEDVAQQLKVMHEEASDVLVVWLKGKPSADDVFHEIRGKHTPMKPHVFAAVCADGKVFKGRAEPCVRIPVLDSDVAKGHIIQHVTHHNVPCRLAGKNTLKDDAELLGKETKIPLKAGKPIYQNQVQQPVLIKKGDFVTVKYEGQSFTVTNQGTAEKDGVADALIPIKCHNKTVLARVVGSNMARLDQL